MKTELDFLHSLRGLCRLARGKGSLEVARTALEEEERLNALIAEREQQQAVADEEVAV